MRMKNLLALAGALALAGGSLCAQPTANEQAMVYELNRARNNPQRYDTEQSLGGLLTGIAASQPLVVNSNLFASARFHADEMATNNYFGHQSAVTGDWPNKMARDAGYPLHSSLSNTANNIESLGAGYADVQVCLRALIEDNGVSPPGHRYHLLATGPSASFYLQMREVGTGYAFNAGSTYQRYYAVHTGYRNADSAWLTGVVYTDSNGNGRYDQGEGLSGVTITASNGTPVQTTTNAQGGYAIAVAAGNWAVTCAGGSFAGTGTANVVVSTLNVACDFASGRSEGEVDFAFQTVGGGHVVNMSASNLGFTSVSVGVPSAEQTFTVSGSRLVGNVNLTAPSEFQISLTSGAGFGGALSLTPSGGTLAATTIFVRYNPTGAGGASGPLTAASSTASTAQINLNGAIVTTPTIFVSSGSLSLTSARLGLASPEQNFTVSGYNLTANLAINAPSQFEVSQTSGSGFGASVSLTPASGTVNPTTIFVRFVPTALSGAGNLACSSASATTKNITLSGTVTNAPVITATPANLTLVSPTSGTPSSEQTFTVSGLYLGAAIAVTAPSGFEITLTSGSGYTSTFNLPATSGVVAATTVYVRYLGGSPSTGNVSCASTLATTRLVALTGTIAPPPTITLSTLSKTFTSTAVGTPSGDQFFTVWGSNLLGNVDLVVSGEFEISLTAGSGYTGNLSLVPTAGTLASTNIFVRYNPVGAAGSSGDVSHSSPGATTRVLTLSGTISAGGGGGGGGSGSGGGGCAVSWGHASWFTALVLAAPLFRRRRAARAGKR
ncbi:MAG: hypothetical protein IPP14_03945 [Planctomycetes bacterium]|nr:hypothetical protein [Planctomycetota bacterium]